MDGLNTVLNHNFIPFLHEMSSSGPVCNLLLVSQWFASFFCDPHQIFFTYKEFAWSHHFHWETECVSIKFYSNLFSHHFLCVLIRWHQVEDWVLSALLLTPFSVFFSSKIGYDIPADLRQNGVRGKLVCCTDSIVWWCCSTLEVKQSYSRSKGAPCFEL